MRAVFHLEHPQCVDNLTGFHVAQFDWLCDTFSSGIVVEDCLLLLQNLLKNNNSNQNFFKEGSYIQRMKPWFEVGDDNCGWSAQKVTNLHLMLQVRCHCSSWWPMAALCQLLCSESVMSQLRNPVLQLRVSSLCSWAVLLSAQTPSEGNLSWLVITWLHVTWDLTEI